ncbi:MAG: helix-turn-helix domain-containing protein [Pseudomonadota bacterium]
MPAKEIPTDKKRVRAPTIESPYINADEAAVYLRISLRALENFRTTADGPAYRKHGGRVLYHIHDLDRWSARRRYRSSAKRDEE